MLAGAVKPAVVRDINQEIGRGLGAVRAGILAGEVRVGVFVTDDDAIVVLAKGKTR